MNDVKYPGHAEDCGAEQGNSFPPLNQYALWLAEGYLNIYHSENAAGYAERQQQEQI